MDERRNAMTRVSPPLASRSFLSSVASIGTLRAVELIIEVFILSHIVGEKVVQHTRRPRRAKTVQLASLAQRMPQRMLRRNVDEVERSEQPQTGKKSAAGNHMKQRTAARTLHAGGGIDVRAESSAALAQGACACRAAPEAAAACAPNVAEPPRSSAPAWSIALTASSLPASRPWACARRPSSRPACVGRLCQGRCRPDRRHPSACSEV